MTVELSERQLEEIRRGESISIRFPELAEPLVVCPQSEFAMAVLSVIQEIRKRAGDQMTDEELKSEIEDALVRRAWAEMGEKTRNAWAEENSY